MAAYIVLRGHNTPQPTRRAPGDRPAPHRAGSLSSAAELLVLLKQLDAENAQWSRILTASNPSGDRAIAALLQDFQGPHMFAPHTAPSVMLDGARNAGPNSSRGFGPCCCMSS